MRDDIDDVVMTPNGDGTFQIHEIPPTPALNAAESQIPQTRSRTNSTPSSHPLAFPTQPYPLLPPSAGPYRTSFAARPTTNGHAMRPSMSTPTYPNHSSALSGSYSNFLPPSPSPLSNSFPRSRHESSPSPSAASSPKVFAFPSSSTAPELQRSVSNGATPANSRRHNRIHSRNLSVFFPQPGMLPHSSIAEDGSTAQAPISIIPSADDQTEFSSGFKFGSQPSQSNNLELSSASRTSRRGHHHKHSMSHNFFSFLEPGTREQSPIPPSVPVSPSTAALDVSPDKPSPSPPPPLPPPLPSVGHLGMVISVSEFLLGASLWVSGQQTGSLSCTGLGYWVVFDAFGVALSRVVPGYLASDGLQSRTRRTYGNGRLETVMMFSQCIYLIFSAVYVCKETVEHMLLSAGDDMQHHGDHHHHSDSNGLSFILTVLALISLVGTAFACENHTKLVQVTGRQLPQLTSLLPSTRTSFTISSNKNQPTTPLALLLSNPFSVSPIAFTLTIISMIYFIPDHQQRKFDLILAGIEAAVTLSVAYPAAVSLGSVLLQTSPARGLSSGRMESFLRAMKEIERHPQVLHLPPPHIWQLTPSIPTKQSLVVTLELHVRKDLDDEDVLKLTKWAWDRCVSGLGFSRGAGKLPEGTGAPEVTVGIVKG